MLDNIFRAIENSHVVMRFNGAYWASSIFVHKNRPYAKWGNRYVSLTPDGYTSKTNLMWDNSSHDMPTDRHGKLVLTDPAVPVVEEE